MLPPQLRSGKAVSKYRISSSNALRVATNAHIKASAGYVQSRSYWRGGHRWDWVSHLDPVYQRYARVRTLKTRAKLLKNLRRRGAFEWDNSTKPFFTPRNLRCASHWRGRQWYTNDDPKERMKEEAAAEEENKVEEDGYELSKREKEWKDQMEAMRKHIKQDPYEAVFGKRFEPFWSPLVPSWMREEMGLRDWPKQEAKESMKTRPVTQKGSNELSSTPGSLRDKLDATTARVAASQFQPSKSERKPIDRLVREARVDESSQQIASGSSKPFSRMTAKERVKHVRQILDTQATPKTEAPQAETKPNSYAYASSTSWDSVSNKTKKVEWDSTSNRTKTFEYDPISNRMVEVAAPNIVAIDSDSSAVRQSVGSPKESFAAKPSEPGKPVDIPIKQSSDIRKAIPIPPPLSQPSHSITLGYTRTSVGPLRSTAVSPASVKPAALAKMPAQDLDLLTADNVRASMGKVKDPASTTKASTAEEKVELERDFESNSSAKDAQGEAILKERHARKAATLENFGPTLCSRDELESAFKRMWQVAEYGKGVSPRSPKFMELENQLMDIKQRLGVTHESMHESISSMTGKTKRSPLQTSLQRAEAKNGSSMLQSSLERMQSKELPTALEQDLDDAAAHESTEPVAPRTSVPKEWTKAADLLQADRVKRTADKRPFPKTRWVDDMNARKVAYEQRKAEAQAAEDTKNAESKSKLEKVRKMLEAEVAEQKLKMQAFEGRYADKVKSLRGELDTAFKQSSVHSEKHVERIRELEALVSTSKAKELKYADKVKSLRDDLERAYKQSAAHAEKHLEHIRYLEGELGSVASKPAKTAKSEPEMIPAEGDLCLNAPNFGENGKWYKRPANPSQPTAAEVEKVEQKAHDQALVAEVQSIYEKRYGVIDSNHEQPIAQTLGEGLPALSRQIIQTMAEKGDKQQMPRTLTKREAKAERRADRQARRAEKAEEKARQVVEVESDVDLGEELAKYEKENPQTYKVEDSLTAPESAEKMKSVVADSLEQELKIYAREPEVEPSTSNNGIQWADPPLYKVLAYDSGNDMMSSATTTTSVMPDTEMERPLGIPEALAQLYQPARFVPYFADLQSDNFQAIAATREVIVFRQVKKPEAAPRPKTIAEDGYTDYMVQEADEKGRFITEQMAVLKEEERKASPKGRTDNTRVNPIDGTSRPHPGPTTGNFASPTGFVNHDPVFPPERKEQELPNDEKDTITESRSDTYSTIAKEPSAKTSRQIWESLPGSSETPVKRTESVYSGMSRSERQRHEKEMQQRAIERNRLKNLAKKEERRVTAEQKQRELELEQQYERMDEQFARERDEEQSSGKTSSGSGSRTLRYMLGAGVSAGGVMYLVGALAERERTNGQVSGSGSSANEEMERRTARYRQGLEQERKRLGDEAARLTREWNRR